MMIAVWVAPMLLATAPLYGDDMITMLAKQYGYDERDQPCAAEQGEVRIAVLSSGLVVHEGREPAPADEVAGALQARRQDIRGVCLYVEGPMSEQSRSAFLTIWHAVRKSNLHVTRFADPGFEKRVVPRVGDGASGKRTPAEPAPEPDDSAASR